MIVATRLGIVPIDGGSRSDPMMRLTGSCESLSLSLPSDDATDWIMRLSFPYCTVPSCSGAGDVWEVTCRDGYKVWDESRQTVDLDEHCAAADSYTLQCRRCQLEPVAVNEVGTARYTEPITHCKGVLVACP